MASWNDARYLDDEIALAQREWFQAKRRAEENPFEQRYRDEAEMRKTVYLMAKYHRANVFQLNYTEETRV